MKKMIVCFFLFCFNVFASPEFIVLGGSADYKAKVSGGHYELTEVQYYYDAKGNLRLLLDFSKDFKKFVTQTQQEEILVDFANLRQIRVQSDCCENYHALTRGQNTIQIKTNKGTVALTVQTIETSK